MAWLLLAMLSWTVFAAAPPEVARVSAQRGLDGPGRLVSVGEAVGPATVVRVETHPEFERLHLEALGGPLPPIEVVEAKGGRAGICVHHGLTLFPRWELIGPVPEDPWHEGERPPQTVEEQVHAALCARLAEEGARLRLEPEIQVAAPDGGPPPPQEAPMRRAGLRVAPAGTLPAVWATIGALALGLGMAGARRLDRAGWRDLALVLGLAAATRFALASPVVFNGGLAGYEKLVMGLGLKATPDLYGQGWPTVLAPAVALLGARPSTVFLAHRLLSLLAPAALWAALRPSSPGAARLAGLLLAVLPLAVLLAPTEEMSVPTLTLGLVAAAAAARGGRGLWGLAAGALAGLSAGLACHVRPEGLLLLPAVGALPLALRGRSALREGGTWLALLLGGALVLGRLAELPEAPDGGPLDLSRLVQPRFVAMALLPAWESRRVPIHLFLDAAWTSPVLWLGVALSLVGSRRAWRPLLPWLLWIAGTSVLLAKSWPLADAWRLQLLVMPGWLALAALGLSARLARPAWLAAVVGLVALPLAWQRLDFARHDEWRWLAQVVPTLPQGAALRFHDPGTAGAQDKARDMAVVLATLRPGLVQVADSAEPPRSGQLVLMGLGCFESAVRDEAGAPQVHRAADGCPQAADAGCALAPVDQAWVSARTDLDTRVDPERVVDGRLLLGIYRLEGCRQAEPGGSDPFSAPPSAP